MITTTKENKTLRFASVALAMGLVGLGAWLSHAKGAHASDSHATTGLSVMQQVGYAGQVSESVTGRHPVTFGLYSAGGDLVYEETINAEIRKGRFQVNVGSKKGDLRNELKDSQQMKVFFDGNLLDSVSVVHATEADLRSNSRQYSDLHAVVFTDEAHERLPCSLGRTCTLVESGYFTIPFTNTNVGVTAPDCAPQFAFSTGYNFLTLPSQGVVLFGLSPGPTYWQVNYEVGATPATLQITSVCCR
jgi:hypothetical protein